MTKAPYNERYGGWRPTVILYATVAIAAVIRFYVPSLWHFVLILLAATLVFYLAKAYTRVWDSLMALGTDMLTLTTASLMYAAFFTAPPILVALLSAGILAIPVNKSSAIWGTLNVIAFCICFSVIAYISFWLVVLDGGFGAIMHFLSNFIKG